MKLNGFGFEHRKFILGTISYVHRLWHSTRQVGAYALTKYAVACLR